MLEKPITSEHKDYEKHDGITGICESPLINSDLLECIEGLSWQEKYLD